MEKQGGIASLINFIEEITTKNGQENYTFFWENIRHNQGCVVVIAYPYKRRDYFKFQKSSGQTVKVKSKKFQ